MQGKRWSIVCMLIPDFSMTSGPSDVKMRAYITLFVILILLILLSLPFLLFEFCVKLSMGKRKFLSYNCDAVIQFLSNNCDTVVQAGSFLFTIVFVVGFWNDCWCIRPWQWQIGALAVFLSYINLILHLRGFPVLGVFSNLLVHIVIKFLQLIYLLLLLILAFSIPFYMLFVRDGAAVFVSY